MRATIPTLTLLVLALALALASAGCGNGAVSGIATGSGDDVGGDTADDSAEGFGPRFAAGGALNTFHHPAAIGGSSTTPREAMRRMEEEGPPAYSARVHSCRKVRYGTLGRVLRSRGVDLGSDGELSAGRMWRDGDQALGAPNYGARIGETTEVTVASSSRMFDIFVQAAPEIIAQLPAREECAVAGVGTALFDESGRCTEAGLTCLLGVPATDAHLTVCNDTVRRAPTVDEGQRLAVAALLAAAFTCE